MDTKYVVIIQCELSHKRCSGFACTNSFYNKEGFFKGYDDKTKYISFTCGGCCGKTVASKLEHFTKKLKKAENIGKGQVVVHLASCIVTENYHSDRCPHVDYIKGIVEKKGFKVVDGSFISANAEKKREEGKYNTYE